MIKNDDNIKNILQQKEHPKLSDTFEDDLMSKIHQHSSAKDANKKNLLMMYVFFAFGIIFGFLLSLSFEEINIPIRGINISLNKMTLAIPLVFGILFLFEKIYKTTKFQKGKSRIFDI